jgi:GNAT superfamily N-acetyltransferase
MVRIHKPLTSIFSAINMRRANHNDLNFIADCFIKISLSMKSGNSDIYTSNLPSKIDNSVIKMASDYLDNDYCIALIHENNEKPVACLLGMISPSSFPPANLGKVGHISLCWVEPEFRMSGIASQLVNYAETWFRENSIDVVELSYLAKNHFAEISWEKLGYEPFRIFSYKQLSSS